MYPNQQYLKYNGAYYPLAQWQKLQGKETVVKEVKKVDILSDNEAITKEVAQEVQARDLDLERARTEYEEAYGKIVPKNKCNDKEWINNKIQEHKRSMI